MSQEKEKYIKSILGKKDRIGLNAHRLAMIIKKAENPETELSAMRGRLSMIRVRVKNLTAELLNALSVEELETLYREVNRFFFFSQRVIREDSTHNISKSLKVIFINSVNDLYKSLMGVRAKRAELQNNKEYIEKQINDRTDFVEELGRRIQDLEASVTTNILPKISAAAVAAEIDIFNDLVKQYKAKAAESFWALIATVGLIAIIAKCSVDRILNDADFREVYLSLESFDKAAVLTTKAVVIIVLGFLARNFARSYAANAHCEIVSAHKASALTVYRMLYASGISDQTKDEILKHAANSIFSEPATPYVKSSGDTNSVSFLPSPTMNLGSVTQA